MKILVTGAAGFIGSNLVERLSEVGEVRGLDDLSTGYLRNIEGLNLDFIEGSILDETTLKKAVQGCDAIVHLAARPSVPRSLAEPPPFQQSAPDERGRQARHRDGGIAHFASSEKKHPVSANQDAGRQKMKRRAQRQPQPPAQKRGDHPQGGRGQAGAPYH